MTYEILRLFNVSERLLLLSKEIKYITNNLVPAKERHLKLIEVAWRLENISDGIVITIASRLQPEKEDIPLTKREQKGIVDAIDAAKECVSMIEEAALAESKKKLIEIIETAEIILLPYKEN